MTTNASDLVKKAKALVNRDVSLIPNGIDTDQFKPMTRSEALAKALGLDNHVIGIAGELREKKDLYTLLNGYAQLNKRRPTVLLIVGEVR